MRVLPPMRPGIFLPGHTLPGSWQAPMLPPALCALLLPCDAGWPAKPQRFITPWNPLPMVVPACRSLFRLVPYRKLPCNGSRAALHNSAPVIQTLAGMSLPSTNPMLTSNAEDC